MLSFLVQMIGKTNVSALICYNFRPYLHLDVGIHFSGIPKKLDRDAFLKNTDFGAKEHVGRVKQIW